MTAAMHHAPTTKTRRTTRYLVARELGTLKEGQRFRMAADHDRRGTVVSLSPSGCLVRLDAPPAMNTFTTRDERTLSFPKRLRPIRWSAATLVEPEA